MRLLNDVWIDVFVWRGTEMSSRGAAGEWVPLDGGSTVQATERTFPRANQRVVDDWLDAIAENREPACSGRAAMKSLEMIHAVFAAGLSRGRVPFPLADRAHPLAG